MQQDISEYPLIAKSRGAAAFKTTLQGFFKAFVQTIAQTGLLYEHTELLENIQVWLSTMSSAPNRPFRHTSTVASLEVISALCDVASDIVDSTAKKNRQSETESKKARVNKARVSAVNREIAEMNQKLEVVDAFISDWFSTVYVHRYRDVDPKIRLECVEALANWIMTYPDKFFDGQHLRYLGWVLSDPHPPTRVEVLKQLQKMFRDKDKLAGLRTFTERFRPRMVEMATHDAETNVKAAAVQLLDTLREAGFLEPDDVDSVGKLIFDSEPKVRKAVTGFFAETINSVYEQMVEDMGGQEALDEALEDEDEESRNPRLEWLKLKCLAEQLVAYDSDDTENATQSQRHGPSGTDLTQRANFESRFYLAAQSLYDAIPELRSWEVLANYLIHDHSQSVQNGGGEDAEAMLKENCKLSEREETVLLDVLTASVKISLQHLHEAQNDRKKTRSEREAAKEEEAEALQKLTTMIPQLLKKFGAIPEAAALCLRLERQLNLDIFQELRQNSALTALLDDVNKQFLTHHNEQVLDEAVESILHALTHEESREVTESKVQGLWDDLANTFDVLRSGRALSKSGDLPPNILTGLTNTVVKIAKLSRISEPVVLDRTPTPQSTTSASKGRSKKGSAAATEATTAPVESLLEILQLAVDNSEETDAETEQAEHTLVLASLQALLFYFIWKCRNIGQAIASGTAPSDDLVEAVATRKDACVAACARIMQTHKGADVNNMFYSLLRHASADGEDGNVQNQNATADDDWKVLCHAISPPATKILLHILTALESQLAKRTGRQLLPASSSSASKNRNADDDEAIDADPQSDVEADPVDPDDPEPGSSSDEDVDEEEAETQGLLSEEDKLQRKQERAFLAELKLCRFGGKMVHGVRVGTLGDDVKRRLQRNGNRLGQSWKEVLAFLEDGSGGKTKAATREPRVARPKVVKAKAVKEKAPVREKRKGASSRPKKTPKERAPPAQKSRTQPRRSTTGKTIVDVSDSEVEDEDEVEQEVVDDEIESVGDDDEEQVDAERGDDIEDEDAEEEGNGEEGEDQDGEGDE
jgi:cohesin complex subunit SA-1/2